MPERDPYSWEIHDRDGFFYPQFSAGVETGFWSTDWAHRPEQIAGITARPLDDMRPAIGVLVPDGCRAIYRWERRIHADPPYTTEAQRRGHRILTLGFEPVGEPGGIYTHIDEMGNVIVTIEPRLPND